MKKSFSGVWNLYVRATVMARGLTSTWSTDAEVPSSALTKCTATALDRRWRPSSGAPRLMSDAVPDELAFITFEGSASKDWNLNGTLSDSPASKNSLFPARASSSMPGATGGRPEADRSARHSAVDATRDTSGSSHRTSKTQSRSAGDLNSCSKKHSSPKDGRITLRPLMPLRSFSRTADRLARRRAASMSSSSLARTSLSANSGAAGGEVSASRP